MNFCKVSEWQIMKVTYEQFHYLLPSGLVLFQPVNSCSLRLIFGPATLGWLSVSLFAVTSAYMAVEGLAMLLSWPASQSEFLSPHLTGARRQRSNYPIKTPRWLWRFISECPAGSLQLLGRTAVPRGAHIAFQRCFISKSIRDVLIQTRLFLPSSQRRQAVLSSSRVVSAAMELLRGLCWGWVSAGCWDQWGQCAPPLPPLHHWPSSAASCAASVAYIGCRSAVLFMYSQRGNCTLWEGQMRFSDPKPPKRRFKRFLKPELSSSQPQVKYLNLCLGIKILKSCGTILVFHTIPQSLQFFSGSLFRSLGMELQSQQSGEDWEHPAKLCWVRNLRTEIWKKSTAGIWVLIFRSKTKTSKQINWNKK